MHTSAQQREQLPRAERGQLRCGAGAGQRVGADAGPGDGFSEPAYSAVTLNHNAHLPDLATVNNLAVDLAEAGHRVEALTTAHEAVDLYRPAH